MTVYIATGADGRIAAVFDSLETVMQANTSDVLRVSPLGGYLLGPVVPSADAHTWHLTRWEVKCQATR